MPTTINCIQPSAVVAIISIQQLQQLEIQSKVLCEVPPPLFCREILGSTKMDANNNVV